MGVKAAYFQNGYLIDVSPRNCSISLYEDRQVAYDADTVIVSDGDVYDPNRPERIAFLRIPNFDPDTGDTVFDLSYILKMRCGMLEDSTFIPCFVSATLKMMEASPIGWGRRDYLTVIQNFYRVGLFPEGDCFEAQYRQHNQEAFCLSVDEIYEAECLSRKYYYEGKWRRYQEFYEVKALLPDIVPDTPRGYMQIRTRKTKRFLEIQASAEAKGYVFDTDIEKHQCRKHATRVAMSYVQEQKGNYQFITQCLCPIYTNGNCNGKDEFGCPCVYPLK